MFKILQPKKRIETSKKIVLCTGLLFLSQLICGIIFLYIDKSTDLFVYCIPSTATAFTASIIFYLNKAKLENALKIKISYVKFKIRVSSKLPEDVLFDIDNEFNILEESINSKLDLTIQDTINEDVTSG